MLIIGLHGLPRSGKDSVADILKTQGYTRRAFADPLKEAASVLLNRPLSQCQGIGFDREAIMAEWGFSMRWFLQVLGTECMRLQVRQDFWINRLAVTMLTVPMNTVITDVRFENEAAMIRELGGVLVEVTRPGTEGSAHASDQPVKCDFTLHNGGTLADLQVSVLTLLRGIFAHTLAPTLADYSNEAIDIDGNHVALVDPPPAQPKFSGFAPHQIIRAEPPCGDLDTADGNPHG